jgi:virginiamycin B lyase
MDRGWRGVVSQGWPWFGLCFFDGGSCRGRRGGRAGSTEDRMFYSRCVVAVLSERRAIVRRVGLLLALALSGVVGVLPASSGARTLRAGVTPKITPYALPDHSNPGGVVEGPDGNLWATESDAGAIVRVTPSGQITTYPLEPKRFPGYITVGGDGALWFTVEPNTEDTEQGIGRISTTGQISFWSIPTIFDVPDLPLDIVADPQDKKTLWFTFQTKSQAGGIGRVSIDDPSKVTVFSLGPESDPLTIRPGPDQTFWFTEENANRIGSITTRAEIKTYPVPGHPFGLASSPAGGFWFTEYDGNRVGQITRDGHVTQCPTFTPDNTHPTFILRKNDLFWLFQSGQETDPDHPVPVEAHLTAMNEQCQKESWALPAQPGGEATVPWYLGSGKGDSLAFTLISPDAVGTIAFNPQTHTPK